MRVLLYSEFHSCSVHTLCAFAEINEESLNTSDSLFNFWSQLICRFKSIADFKCTKLTFHNRVVNAIEILLIRLVPIKLGVNYN